MAEVSKSDIISLRDLQRKPIGILNITIKNATGIPPMDLNGKADPYVVLKFGTKVMKTPIIKKTLLPSWDHTFRLLVYPEDIKLDVIFELWDWDKLSKDDFIATVVLNLADFTSPERADNEHLVTLPFTPPKKIKKAKGPSELCLTLQYSTEDALLLEFWKGLIDYFDVDDSKSIDREEFSNVLVGLQSDQELVDDMGEEAIFSAIDADGDGFITADELTEFIKSGDALGKQLWHTLSETMWEVFLALNDGATVGDMVVNDWRIEGVDMGGKVKDNKVLKNQILVHVRDTGKLEVELIPSYIRVAMKMMYSNGIGRATTNKVQSVLSSMTERQGRTYNNPKSKNEIPKFIKFHMLNTDEILDDMDSFSNFNEFFYRKLKPNARPISNVKDDKVVVSPADCRLHVFPSISEAQEIWVKGKTFSLTTLLQDNDLASEYDNCSLVIARLAPQDYHRYHSPVGGKVGDFRTISGSYFTVNPIAINQKIDVYGLNKRLITSIETEHFGKVLFIAVGATMVGSINMTVEPGKEVKKGNELGYFAFGGSTCLVLFKQGSIVFDQDLMVNSAKPIETLIKVGDRIGVASS